MMGRCRPSSSCRRTWSRRRTRTCTTGGGTGSAAAGDRRGPGGRWELTLGSPFQPGGECSWTAPARDAAGRDLVLKVGWTHDEGRDEARKPAGLGRSGHGAAVRRPRRRRHDQPCCSNAPGPAPSWAARCPRRSRTASSPGCCGGSGSSRRPATAFRPLTEMCEAWAREHEEHPAPHASTPASSRPGWSSGGQPADHRRPRGAAAHRPARRQHPGGRARAVAGDRPEAVRRRPGVRPDAAHAQLPRPADAPTRTGWSSGWPTCARLDRERLRLWLFARCVVESPWWPDLAPVAVATAP